MKRIILLFLLGILLIGCDETLELPSIITKIEKSGIGKKYSYRVYVDNNSTIWIYTNDIYSIGDTLKIVKK